MASGGSKQKPNKGLSREEKESKKVFEEAHIMIDKMRMDMGKRVATGESSLNIVEDMIKKLNIFWDSVFDGEIKNGKSAIDEANAEINFKIKASQLGFLRREKSYDDSDQSPLKGIEAQYLLFPIRQ